jgi:hypothetical protein
MLLPASICDDAYISFRVADNLAAGNGMVFNPGEAAYVSTAPLWVILVAAITPVTGDVVVSAMILGTLFEMLAAMALVWLGSAFRPGPAVGVVAAMMLLTNPFFLFSSFSGMETSLYIFLIVLSLALLARERLVLAATIAALSVWARFDGLLLFGVVAVWTVWTRRGAGVPPRASALRDLLPSLAVLAAYLLFGFFVFGDAVPMSVQRKTSDVVPLLSPEWTAGAATLLGHYLHVFLETSGYWLSQKVLLILLGVPLLLGAARVFYDRERRFIPVAVFSLLHMLSVVASGHTILVSWMWYFAPVLPGAYLLVAKGWVWLASLVTDTRGLLRALRRPAAALAVFVVLWSVFMLIGPLKREARRYAVSEEGNAGRERYYAALAVWAGNHLPAGATIAAIEIGALGFFLPPEMAVLDIYGILRRDEDAGRSYLEMIERDRPELVISLAKFYPRSEIEDAHPGLYVWERLEHIDIGVRADLHPALTKRLTEVPALYEGIDIRREYHWER